MDLGIRDRVALVTGGARSLGKADADVLAAEGCRVAIVDLNAEGAEEAARDIAARGGTARGYECDIRDTARVQEVVSRIETDLRPIDICVNNAGMIYTVGQLRDMRDEDWELNLSVNLTGTFKVTRAVFPGMRERRWGRIVCMASIAGLMGGFGQTAYSTSKIGVIGFAKSVALEGARHNVTCNAVAPGISRRTRRCRRSTSGWSSAWPCRGKASPRTSPTRSCSCAPSVPATSPAPCCR